MEFILFIGVIILVFWIASVSNRVHKLERKLAQGAVSVDSDRAGTDQTRKVIAEREFLRQASVSPKASEIATPKSPAPMSEVKPMTEAQRTELATNWLNKIGMVALLLGMVFFFKYAVDQGWINPWMRVLIGFVVAGLLVYLGELWRQKYGSRAYALSGGGIALFYFTIFAAYQFYGLIPQLVAWTFMLAAAALSVFLSFRYSSLVLAVLGFFGAYGSPLMLSSGKDQQVALLVYLGVLTVVALVICAKKFWVELLFLSLLGTAINLAVWADTYSIQANTLISVFFVIFTSAVLLFGSSALLRHHKAKNTLPGFLDRNLCALYVFSGFFYFCAVFLLLDKNFHSFLAPISLLGSVIFFTTYAFVDRLEYRGVNYCLSLVASWLLVYAAVWQFDEKALAFALLFIALMISGIGFLLKREELRVWGLAILFASLFMSLFEPYGAEDKLFLFNAKFGLMLANTLGMIFIGWLYSKFEVSLFEKNVDQVLQVAAALVLWAAVSWDIFAGIKPYGGGDNFMAFWWIVYPSALAWVAFAGRRKALMKLSVLLLCGSLIRVLILPYENSPAIFFNTKFGLMLAQTVALFLVGWFYSKSEEKIQNQDAFFAVGSLLFCFSVSWEIVEYFSGSQNMNARNLFLSLWWLAYAVILMAAGSFLKKSIFRKVSLALFVLSILKVFLYDAQALDTPYRIIAFIVLGVILLSVSFSYRKNKEKIVNFLEGENKL